MHTILGTIIEATPRLSRQQGKPEVSLAVQGDDGVIRYKSMSLANTPIATGVNKGKPIQGITLEVLESAIGEPFNPSAKGDSYDKLLDKRVMQTISDEPYVTEDGAEYDQIERFKFLGATTVDADAFDKLLG